MGNNNSRANTYQQYYEAMQQQQPIQIPNDISPYDILGVSKNFTWEELKDAYKRQARLVHPDKGGNKQLFNLVTDAFKTLAYDFKLKQKDKQHHELKQNYQMDSKADLRPSYRPELVQEGNFNDKFNRVFEENKFEDEDDDVARGYGHMMAKSSKNREDIDVPQVMKKYNNEKFNDIFNKTAPVSKEVIVYKEPEPLVLTRKLNYTEIGKPTEDFSTDTTKKSNLQYTDYMKAHTTSRLVDPRSIKERKTYKTVEDYDKDRTRIANKKLTEEEIRYQKRMELKKEKEEEERIKRINNRDERINDYYERTSKLFLQ
jgi:curved DNA-binding protein CbpA